MKHIRKYVRSIAALSTLAALLCSTAPLRADYVADTSGFCYEDCRRAPCIAPAIALGTVALVAIIAVAVQNTGHDDHCHTSHHSHCN
jgi:hypothetical protein